MATVLSPVAAIGQGRLTVVGSHFNDGHHSPYETIGLTEQGLESN
jgi:hypothetical protein